MFNFFKSPDRSKLAEEFGKKSTIEPIYENGLIAGFMIRLESDAVNFIKKNCDTESLSIFVNLIDERIGKNDFVDRTGYLDYPFENHSKDNILVVTRIIADHKNDIIFHWTPEYTK